jgi:hypothetical protein
MQNVVDVGGLNGRKVRGLAFGEGSLGGVRGQTSLRSRELSVSFDLSLP